jgi:hypothetical protein
MCSAACASPLNWMCCAVLCCPLRCYQAGSLSTLDKALACMDEAKRKKLEEMVQEAARGGRPGAAAAAAPSARPAAAGSRGTSRAASQQASVSSMCR